MKRSYLRNPFDVPALDAEAWRLQARGLVQLGRRPGPVPEGPARPGAPAEI